MTLELDPELLEHLMARFAGGGATRPVIERDDVAGLRAFGDAAVAAMDGALPEHPDVVRRTVAVRSYDGVDVMARWYEPSTRSRSGAAVVYLHGGGMIMGSADLSDRLVAGYVAESGVPMLSVDYRRAPENPHPAPVEDSFAGLAWLAANATDHDVDATRIAVMGESGGGGLAAGVALLARERGVPLARQVLIYPMLDDRTTNPDPHIAPYAGWTYDNNYTGWHALLGDAIGTADVPAAAAPARATDLAGLPPTFIDVGELDIFRDESIEFARRLGLAGTSVELHVRPGCPHGFDLLGSDLDIGKRTRADRIRVLKSI